MDSPTNSLKMKIAPKYENSMEKMKIAQEGEKVKNCIWQFFCLWFPGVFGHFEVISHISFRNSVFISIRQQDREGPRGEI